MDNKDHNGREYSAADVADIVDRTSARITQLARENKIEVSRKIGSAYLITERGLEQAKEYFANSKPGPKGPHKKKNKAKRRETT